MDGASKLVGKQQKENGREFVCSLTTSLNLEPLKFSMGSVPYETKRKFIKVKKSSAASKGAGTDATVVNEVQMSPNAMPLSQETAEEVGFTMPHLKP